MDSKELEIMAPAGNFECLAAAIEGGADSVYFGVGNLNMRSGSAKNFAPEDLDEVVSICHRNSVKAYMTLNITLYQSDLESMRKTLDAAKAAGVDAIIASDMACIAYCRKIGLEVHISTQLSISNAESLRFYSQFADVVVLAREVSLAQVKEIHRTIEEENICGPSGRQVRLEMFAHGAFCMAVSGKCYLSLMTYGKSSNRGECMQVCRHGYMVTDIKSGNQTGKPRTRSTISHAASFLLGFTLSLTIFVIGVSEMICEVTYSTVPIPSTASRSLMPSSMRSSIISL